MYNFINKFHIPKEQYKLIVKLIVRSKDSYYYIISYIYIFEYNNKFSQYATNMPTFPEIVLLSSAGLYVTDYKYNRWIRDCAWWWSINKTRWKCMIPKSIIFANIYSFFILFVWNKLIYLCYRKFSIPGLMYSLITNSLMSNRVLF